MKLSEQTVSLLKNFASINQNLQFKSGNKLSTISAQKNILVNAEIPETFPSDFAIYDLNKMLGVMNLFPDPEMEIGDNTMKIILFERKSTRPVTDTKEKLILPEEVSPDVYKVLLENEDVKVTEVTFKPGQGDEMHQHGVMSIYGIIGGKLQNTSPDGTVREMEVADGFVGHRNTVTTHQMKNIGDTTVKVILVEHKKLGLPEA